MPPKAPCETYRLGSDSKTPSLKVESSPSIRLQVPYFAALTLSAKCLYEAKVPWAGRGRPNMRRPDAIKEATKTSLPRPSRLLRTGHCGHHSFAASPGVEAVSTQRCPGTHTKGAAAASPSLCHAILSSPPLGVKLANTYQRASPTGAEEQERQAHWPAGSAISPLRPSGICAESRRSAGHRRPGAALQERNPAAGALGPDQTLSCVPWVTSFKQASPLPSRPAVSAQPGTGHLGERRYPRF